MAVKNYKPTSPGRRGASVLSFEEITTNKPEKSLLYTKKKTGGRNAHGRITVRHIGGGHKQKLRIIDFKRQKDGVPATVATIGIYPLLITISSGAGFISLISPTNPKSALVTSFSAINILPSSPQSPIARPP